MSWETLLVDVAGAVATVTLNRPEARNALNRTLVRELGDALEGLGRDPAVRAVVLRGAGDRAFCAGADLKGMFQAASALEAREQYAGLGRILEGIPRLRVPVIAQVHGYALAGGCGLAVACDLVVASEDAVFGLPEIRLALLPLMVLAPILRAGAPKRVLQMVLTGAEVSAREALEMGLVTCVVPRADLEATVTRLARTVAGWSPTAVALAKEAFYTALGLEYGRALAYLRDLLTIVAQSEDAREGIRAFLEKRPPVWTGR
ncbi:MAG: enoyl-CoA hydratase-related protein [Armatimonadota bacterium]|nr:enoyl-CoA hydratase-related protein [Armatimonadota bacterium]MDR7492265.1 enoyl-CoA hydratase-related protein [Armatimonadota bacterium]MDR7593205.1 enoyl-CoA hydratase-related protein [Armatimonadota bacterium]